jgi:hypothetical protein
MRNWFSILADYLHRIVRSRAHANIVLVLISMLLAAIVLEGSLLLKR